MGASLLMAGGAQLWQRTPHESPASALCWSAARVRLKCLCTVWWPVQCVHNNGTENQAATELWVWLQVLLRRTKHNPLLIGEAGVGKTAVSTSYVPHPICSQIG